VKKRLIITESEKEQILSLYKPVISEDIKGTSYFTENPQRIYYNPALKSLGIGDYIDIKKGTEFKKTTISSGKGASAWNDTLLFACNGAISRNNAGTKWELNFIYKKKWLYNDVLSKKLKSIFCKVGGKLVDGCIKGDCRTGRARLPERNDRSTVEAGKQRKPPAAARSGIDGLAETGKGGLIPAGDGCPQ